MKKKIYIVAFNDLVIYGYGTKSVKVFTDENEAKEYIKDEYLAKCEEENIEEPLAEDSYDYEYGGNYAYINGKYYWDIFTREIEI